MSRTGAGARVYCMVVLLASACVQSVTRTETGARPLGADAAMRPATNLPPQFSVVTPGRSPGDCPGRLRDDGLGTELSLRRSLMLPVPDSAAVAHRSYGDYAAEPYGRYGDLPGEGLRIDCVRLRALGVVQL